MISASNPKPAFKRTLFIGLGGSGAKILTRLKRDFIEHYGRVPACKRFLALDTDPDLPKLDSLTDAKVVQLDPTSEFLYLQVPSPLRSIDAIQAREWLIEPLPTQAITAGTGAVRQVGRLALMAHANDFGHAIRKAFTDLQHIGLPRAMDAQGFCLAEVQQGEPDIEVYVCGSIAGGTGSGSFLDMGIFCRHALPERALIYAVLMGPWVYQDVGATFRTPANAYSALMELDTLMTISVAKERSLVEGHDYMVAYDRDPFAVDRPPFNVVHLVDGINQEGRTITDPNELIKFIAEGLFLSTSANAGGVLRSAVDNIMVGLTTTSPEIWNGKHAMYSSFGVAAAVYPAATYVKRATHRYARTMLDSMGAAAEGMAAQPGQPAPDDERDVKRFVEDARIDPDANRVLDGICDLGTVRGIELMAPIAAQLNATYPGSLALEAQQEATAILEAARSTFQDPTERITQALDRYLEHGSCDPRERVSAVSKATRLDLLHRRLRDLLRACDARARDAARRAEQADAGARTAQDTLKGEIEAAGFFTRKSRLLAGAQAAFSTVCERTGQRVRAQVERERVESLQSALAAAVARLEATFAEAARAQQSGGAFSGLVQEALRLYRLRLQDAEHTALRTGLSEFEHVIELPCEVPEEEPARAREDATRLLDELAGQGGVLDGKRLLEAALARAAAYAQRAFAEAIDILDLVEEHHSRHQPPSGLPADTYTGQLIGILEGYGQPLWHFDKGNLNLRRAEAFTEIVIVGAPERSRAERIFKPYPFVGKHAPCFVGTGDRHRVTMVVFASALPIHALTEVAYFQERYHKLFLPPVHSSRFFQLNSEPVIPEKDSETLAFKLLSAGIVTGLDLVSDDKPRKGTPGRYRLLFDLEPDHDHLIRDLRPKLGDKFIDAHSYLLRHPFVTRQLLDRTVTRLEALRSEDRALFDKLLSAQMAKLDDELERRRMNKILTWRYMRREIELLRRIQLWQGPFDELFV
ncbi:MAG: tubulin-like doman-containing protein [Pseudomonadota bacterium]